jgi:hypothetical protein
LEIQTNSVTNSPNQVEKTAALANIIALSYVTLKVKVAGGGSISNVVAYVKDSINTITTSSTVTLNGAYQDVSFSMPVTVGTVTAIGIQFDTTAGGTTSVFVDEVRVWK